MTRLKLRCNICGLDSFSDAIDLNDHIKYHRIPCSYCGLVFYRQNNLNFHIRHVHEGVPWLPPQIGAGDEKIVYSGNYFDVITKRRKRNRLGLTETTYSIRFKNLKAKVDDTLTQRMVYLRKMLYRIITVFKANMTDADTAQLILYGNPEALKAAFSTPFMQKSQFSYGYVANRVTELLNSNENFRINNEMYIDVKVLRGSAGRGSSLKNTPHFLKVLLRKRSVLRNKGDDNLCLARALLTARYYHKFLAKQITSDLWKRVRDGSTFLKTRSLMLQRSAGLSPHTAVQIRHIHKFQKLFKDHQIVVHWMKQGRIKKLFSGKHIGEKPLNVFYHNAHFYPILNLTALYGARNTCEYCDAQISNRLYQHVCKAKCFLCHGVKHGCALKTEGNVQTCGECQQKFYSNTCYKQHKRKVYGKKSVCDIYKRCSKCSEVHDGDCKKDRYCEFCQIRKSKRHHDCYINPSRKQDKFYDYVIYDIESRLERVTHENENIHTKHIPNLVCSRLLCYECLTGVFAADCSQCEIRFFTNDLCIREFILYLAEKKDIIAIAHNSSRYDHILLISEIVHVLGNYDLSIIPCGNSLISMSVGKNLHFRDSNLFFKSKLGNLPNFFGFENTPILTRSTDGTITEIFKENKIAKGIYPYKFNKRAHYNYSGPLPPTQYYAVEKMSEGEKKDFHEWYQAKQDENYVFHFWDELRQYCLSDVNILAQSINVYRKMNVVYNIEPFKCVTVAQLTYTIFTNHFLPRDQIVRMPHRRKNSSVKCENWLQYYEHQNNVKVVREHNIPGTNFRSDGYIKDDNHVLEFLGCWYHGHNEEFSSTDIVAGGRSAAEVFRSTLARINQIKELGYKVTTIWECEYEELVKKNADFFKFLPETMTIRSALYGGRTEVFSVYNDYTAQKRKGRAVDIVSLYPSCMVGNAFPVGKPVYIDKKEITQPFNIDDYFGIISCEVIPPAQLHIPVLPYRSKKSGKLTFPLCAECVEEKITICSHINQRCRNLRGCWTTVELCLALSEGYRISKVYQICHFPEKKDDLFVKFILHMLKGKLEASGFPSGVETQLQKEAYVETVLKKTGVALDIKKIKYNSAVRGYCKLKLNSLWGKYAQNPFKKCVTEIVDEYEKMMEINQKIIDKKIVVNNMYSFQHTAGNDAEDDGAYDGDDDTTVLVDYQKSRHHTEVPICSNPILASFVTAYGRIKLYQSLKIIGRSLTYTDTDSAYYSEENDEITSRLDIGENLGQMKDELSPGNHIITQICLAAKTYGYITLKPEKGVTQVVKNKGFTSQINDDINVPALEALYRDPTKYITVENSDFFHRNRRDGTIYMKTLRKQFNYQYQKRIIVDDNTSLPWGYIQDIVV